MCSPRVIYQAANTLSQDIVVRKPYQHRLSEYFPIYKITGENRETKEMHVVIERSQ